MSQTPGLWSPNTVIFTMIIYAISIHFMWWFSCGYNSLCTPICELKQLQVNIQDVSSCWCDEDLFVEFPRWWEKNESGVLVNRWVFFSHLFTKFTTTISSSVVNRTKDLCTHAHTHTVKWEWKHLDWVCYQVAIIVPRPQTTQFKTNLKKRQHYMEKLKQVGEEKAEGPLKSAST